MQSASIMPHSKVAQKACDHCVMQDTLLIQMGITVCSPVLENLKTTYFHLPGQSLYIMGMFARCHL